MIARTLQGKPMKTVGILLPELGEGYHSQVLSGDWPTYLMRGGTTSSSRRTIVTRKDLVAEYPQLLQARVGSTGSWRSIRTWRSRVAGCRRCCVGGAYGDSRRLTNVVLDHHRGGGACAADIFTELGHRKIAVYAWAAVQLGLRRLRWNATLQVARALSLAGVA